MTLKYAVGVDFGTESGRAILVEVVTGREIATSAHEYANSVIDRTLPGSSSPLPSDWALQDPNDYLEVFKHVIPAMLAESGVLLELGISAQVELVIFGAPLLIGALMMLLYGVQTHEQSLEQLSPSFVETASVERVGD